MREGNKNHAYSPVARPFALDIRIEGLLASFPSSSSYLPMNTARYRIRLCRDICRTIFFPVFVLSLVLNFTQTQLGLLTIPSHVLFVVLWASLKGALSNLIQDREARRLGAKHIPRIVGKWPGNIDILLNMLRAFKTSYVLDVYLDLFEEYQCTTLNTRILWTDNVSFVVPRGFMFEGDVCLYQIISMDQEHAKFVLATGFRHFWRGIAQKERMFDLIHTNVFWTIQLISHQGDLSWGGDIQSGRRGDYEFPSFTFYH